MKPESIFIETKTIEGRDGKFYSKVVFHIGIQTFVIDYDVGDSRSVEWVAGQLKSALEDAGCHRVLMSTLIDRSNAKDQEPEGFPASDCSTRYCEVCREPFSELSEELQGELRELFEAVKTCAKCCQQKLKEAYERTMVD